MKASLKDYYYKPNCPGKPASLMNPSNNDMAGTKTKGGTEGGKEGETGRGTWQGLKKGVKEGRTDGHGRD
jgi:hypothetical protein